MSRAGLVAAGVYVFGATWVVVRDARHATGGGFITMKDMGAFFVTFPVGGVMMLLGVEPELGNPFVCAGMILAMAGLVYGVVSWVAGRLF